MNRVLSLPHSSLLPGQLDALQRGRARTRIEADGVVRVLLPFGEVEMRLAQGEAPIDEGTEVYVWWTGAGFACAPCTEVQADAKRRRRIDQRIQDARAKIAEGRADREQRMSSYGDLPTSGPMPLGTIGPAPSGDRDILII